MRNVYFLSLEEKYVQMILAGTKKFEFRKNPKFGILPNCELSEGDIIFVTSDGCIPCCCIVNQILRDKVYYDYFKDYDSGHWKEAGCDDNSERNFDFFCKDILNEHSTAIGLVVLPIDPINVKLIRHTTTNKPWNGRGFIPLQDLKRFSIHGEGVFSYFEKLSHTILEK